MPIFEVKNISFKYDKYDKTSSYVLNDLSFNVEKKDFIALIGKSGSGKSTLINHLNGLLRADSGEILFEGKNIYDKDFDLKNLRFKCGVVFQYPEYQLFSETVIEDVMFGAIKKGLTHDDAYKKSIEVLKYLSIEHLKDEIPFNLSGGEKRKVAFAGIFVMEPDIFIFDEPDAGLDSIARKHFYEMIKEINEVQGKTIIVITHNLDDVVEYANKVIVLNNGRIVSSGKPHEVLFDTKLMNECNLVTPYSVEIINYLKTKNINVDKTKLKFDDLIKELDTVLE